MRESEIAQKLERATEDLGTVAKKLKLARENIANWSGRGYPSSSLGGGGGSGVSNPVEACVFAGELVSEHDVHLGFRPDQMAVDRAQAEKDLGELCRIASRLVVFCYRYTEKLEGSKLDDLECKWCAHAGRFSPPYADSLCRWHYRFRADWGFEPDPHLTRDYLDKSEGNITENKIRQYHPQAVRHTA